MPDTSPWSWEQGTDVHAIHELVRASDAYHCAVYGLRAPVRDPATTRRLTEARAVHVLRCGADLAATFTLTSEPPFTQAISVFPDAPHPAYLQRLAVAPEWLTRTPLLGARCLRRAVQLATAWGSGAVRAEANPDLTATAALLAMFGFTQYGPVQAANGLRRIFLQKDLTRHQRKRQASQDLAPGPRAP